MKVEESIITKAFDNYHGLYAVGKKWNISERIEMWKDAELAFSAPSNCSRGCFESLYKSLTAWQAFRNKKRSWPEAQIFQTMCGLPSDFRLRKLSSLSLEDENGLREILSKMKGLKENKSGPSLVAVSKFLHFWNPRLFIIVDGLMMWNWVFEHNWIWKEIVDLGKSLNIPFGDEDPYLSYPLILMWAGQVTKENPALPKIFAKFVADNISEGDRSKIPTDIESYEAAAMEWFLLGAVELPPEGIQT